MASDPPPEAALIASRRERLGMPKREAARRAGVSEGTWRRIESGRADIARPPGTLAAMAAVLGITPHELAAAGRRDAAGALEQLMADTAAVPDVAEAMGHPDGDAYQALMTDILATLASISAAKLSAGDKRELRAEFLERMRRDAAELQRTLRILRPAGNGPE